jgi:hypothetical protein
MSPHKKPNSKTRLQRKNARAKKEKEDGKTEEWSAGKYYLEGKTKDRDLNGGKCGFAK